jgi:propanol-preferring alcohol dehydrogenase
MMNTMVIDRICDLSHEDQPLTPTQLPVPVVGPKQILIQVTACGVCHTELDEIEGRTPPPTLPVVPGHQVVGRVVERATDAQRYSEGDRVGVAWIFSSCGACDHCLAGAENLCSRFQATGRDANGGYAEFMVAHQDFAYAIPDLYTDAEAAPLLCAGAIGYRSLALTGIRDGDRLGLTGFGASAHLVLKMARHRYPGSPVYVFARNPEERDFARELGAAWAGDTDESPPEQLHRIIDTTPVWRPVVAALAALRPGGRLVINAIRKETGDQEVLQGLNYTDHLWREKEIKSVANVTRRDVDAFLGLAGTIGIHPEVQTYPLKAANKALMELKHHQVRGAKVIVMGS